MISKLAKKSAVVVDFIDNVPMKLHEKFYPLPEFNNYALQHEILFPESVLDDELDFDIERRAVNNYAAQIAADSSISPSLSSSSSSKLLDSDSKPTSPPVLNPETGQTEPNIDGSLAGVINNNFNTTELSISDRENCSTLTAQGQAPSTAHISATAVSGFNGESAYSFINDSGTIRETLFKSLPDDGKYYKLNEAAQQQGPVTNQIRVAPFNKVSSPLQPIPAVHRAPLMAQNCSNNVESSSAAKTGSVLDGGTAGNLHNPATKKKSLFKLEDFELCQSSPFDAVELKTLNVLEELRQILQPSGPVGPPPSANSTTTGHRPILKNDLR